MTKKKLTALVLQGGGALGAFEYGVVKALYEQKGFKPDVITGVSIGAMNAAVLAGSKDDDPVETMGELWDMLTSKEIPFMPQNLQLAMSMPHNKGMYTLNKDMFFSPQTMKSLCDTTPLYSTLDKLIDKKKMNKGKPVLAVTATNVETGEIETFDNMGKSQLGFEHIAASGSLPPCFPMTEINGKYYWDGGVFSNTPLIPAFECLEKLDGDDSKTEREIILVELFPQEGPVPTDMNSIQNRMSQMSFEAKIRHNAGYFDKMNSYIDMIREVDKELPPKSPVRKMDSFKELMGLNKIHKLTIIKHTEPELMTGGADFTYSSVTKRIEQGYKDAIEHLSKQ